MPELISRKPLPKSYCDIPVDAECRREFAGVVYGLQYAGNEHIFNVNGQNYYGYISGRPRELSDYASEVFSGVCFLRVNPQNTTQPHEMISHAICENV
jgi:hypothetical protein